MSQRLFIAIGVAHVTRGVVHVAGASCHKGGSACRRGFLSQGGTRGGSACRRGFLSQGGYCMSQGLLAQVWYHMCHRALLSTGRWRCSCYKGGSACHEALLVRR